MNSGPYPEHAIHKNKKGRQTERGKINTRKIAK